MSRPLIKLRQNEGGEELMEPFGGTRKRINPLLSVSQWSDDKNKALQSLPIPVTSCLLLVDIYSILPQLYFGTIGSRRKPGKHWGSINDISNLSRKYG